MIFTKTNLEDAVVVSMQLHEDERGSFARTFCEEEMRANNMASHYVQMNTNYSAKAGTIRGLHWQEGDAAEAKLVRCISGDVFDVIVDMRATSPTYLKWQGFHLSAIKRDMLYVPPGFAHGFLSLTDDAEITYLVSSPYRPGSEHGLRWNDPVIGIDWPIPITIVSTKDASWPDYTPKG